MNLSRWLRLVSLVLFTGAWSAINAHASESLPVTLDPTQTWVGEIVRQGGGWALAVYVIWMQNRDHRESSSRRQMHEDRLLDQVAASMAAVTAATQAMRGMTEALERRDITDVAGAPGFKKGVTMLNDYGDTHERPILRTGSLWRPLYWLRKLIGGDSVRPSSEQSTDSGSTVVTYAVLGR